MTQFNKALIAWGDMVRSWDDLSKKLPQAVRAALSVHQKTSPVLPLESSMGVVSQASVDQASFDQTLVDDVHVVNVPLFKEIESNAQIKEEPIKEEPAVSIEADTVVALPTTMDIPNGWDFLFDNADLNVAEEEPALVPVGVFDMSKALGQESVKEEIVESFLPDVLEELEDLFPSITEALENLHTADADLVNKLTRDIHTAKGALGQIGAKRVRAVLHHMETVMEETAAGLHDPGSKQKELLELFDRVKELVRPLQTGEWAKSEEMTGVESLQDNQIPKSVRINTDVIDKMVSDVNEERLLALAMSESTARMKSKLRDLDENAQKIFRMLRDLELQAEMQIQSRKSQLQEVGSDFDPLELDQYTRLQELSRLMAEGMSDISEDRRDLGKMISDYETLSAQQYRLLQSSQDELHKTRLVEADTINDRLMSDVRNTAKEVGKDVAFEMGGSRVELDRVFLEKIKGPLGHIIKNAVVHGIEQADERQQLGKPVQGKVSVRFRQISGRVIVEVSDDGYGLRVEKIRQKAIQKGMWNAQQPMTDGQAADMICAPGFTTADQISELAGRGVGMDAVRKEVLELGGRFEIKSVQTKGMTITIQLPASVASASVLVVEAGTESWAVPVEMVEHVVLVSHENLKQAQESGVFRDPKLPEWEGVPFKMLERTNPTQTQSSLAPVLLIKERGQTMALEVGKLVQIFEVPLRASGTIWGNVRGIAGTVILPNGDAIFLLDPFQFTRSTVETLNARDPQHSSKNMPLVMVVDDSLTVRKASTRFLGKSGYQSVMAKDGQEALELLSRVRPAVILMDIEMPRMDGLDCAKHIRQNAQWSEIPIVMITSRTAEKHRQRAQEVGVNEYLGKPFKEAELLKILHKYAPR